MSKLAGHIALVTGASRGIGRAIAVALAREGADVAVNYLTRQAEAREVCGEIEGMGRRAAMLAADVSIGIEVAAMARHIEQQLGAVTILVNNAGISRRQPLDQITERDWDEVVAANLKSAFLVTQAVLPGMRARQWGESSGARSCLGLLAAGYWTSIMPHPKQE